MRQPFASWLFVLIGVNLAVVACSCKPAVPTEGARASVTELRRAGYVAQLREYAGVEHDISDDELAEVSERIGRAADGLTATP